MPCSTVWNLEALSYTGDRPNRYLLINLPRINHATEEDVWLDAATAEWVYENADLCCSGRSFSCRSFTNWASPRRRDCQHNRSRSRLGSREIAVMSPAPVGPPLGAAWECRETASA